MSRDDQIAQRRLLEAAHVAVAVADRHGLDRAPVNVFSVAGLKPMRLAYIETVRFLVTGLVDRIQVSDTGEAMLVLDHVFIVGTDSGTSVADLVPIGHQAVYRESCISGRVQRARALFKDSYEAILGSVVAPSATHPSPVFSRLAEEGFTVDAAVELRRRILEAESC